MNLEIIHVGVLGTNCYVSWDEDKNCFVVDCGGDAWKVAEFIENKGLNSPTHLLLTHGHGDHMAGAADLKEKYPDMQIVINNQDDELLHDVGKSMASVVSPDWRPFKADMFVKEGDKIFSGKTEIAVMETPGHTKGGLTFRKGNQLFCGDTLFQGSMGRTDLYGGNDTQMMVSLKRLGELEGYCVVLPGHGSASNMEDERRANPFIRQAMRV